MQPKPGGVSKQSIRVKYESLENSKLPNTFLFIKSRGILLKNNLVAESPDFICFTVSAVK